MEPDFSLERKGNSKRTFPIQFKPKGLAFMLGKNLLFPNSFGKCKQLWIFYHYFDIYNYN
jgi:hypothetical protein